MKVVKTFQILVATLLINLFGTFCLKTQAQEISQSAQDLKPTEPISEPILFGTNFILLNPKYRENKLVELTIQFDNKGGRGSFNQLSQNILMVSGPIEISISHADFTIPEKTSDRFTIPSYNQSDLNVRLIARTTPLRGLSIGGGIDANRSSNNFDQRNTFQGGPRGEVSFGNEKFQLYGGTTVFVNRGPTKVILDAALWAEISKNIEFYAQYEKRIQSEGADQSVLFADILGTVFEEKNKKGEIVLKSGVFVIQNNLNPQDKYTDLGPEVEVIFSKKGSDVSSILGADAGCSLVSNGCFIQLKAKIRTH